MENQASLKASHEVIASSALVKLSKLFDVCPVTTTLHCENSSMWCKSVDICELFWSQAAVAKEAGLLKLKTTSGVQVEKYDIPWRSANCSRRRLLALDVSLVCEPSMYHLGCSHSRSRAVLAGALRYRPGHDQVEQLLR